VKSKLPVLPTQIARAIPSTRVAGNATTFTFQNTITIIFYHQKVYFNTVNATIQLRSCLKRAYDTGPVLRGARFYRKNFGGDDDVGDSAWKIAAESQSCTDACGTHKMLCSALGLHAHDSGIDSDAEMATKIGVLGGEFIMGENSPISGCASGDESWYPAFHGGRNYPNVCFKSATDRRLGGLETYSCEAKQSKRARLCFCHTERFGRVWKELPGLAKNTGEPLGEIVSGLNLAQCKQKCDDNDECNSISHDASDGTCVLHSKLESPTAELEGNRANPGFMTHYVFFGHIPETVLEVPAATGDITYPFRILSDSTTASTVVVMIIMIMMMMMMIMMLENSYNALHCKRLIQCLYF
jgi:hypothetical protein